MCIYIYTHIDECIDIYTHTHKDMLTQIHIQTKLNHIACLKMTRETTFKTKHWLQLISSLSVLLGKQVMEMLWCLGFRAFLVSFRVFFFFFHLFHFWLLYRSPTEVPITAQHHGPSVCCWMCTLSTPSPWHRMGTPHRPLWAEHGVISSLMHPDNHHPRADTGNTALHSMGIYHEQLELQLNYAPLA